MFSRSFQPSIVSLFSSTGSDPFTGLWSVEKDDALPEDSFIHFLNDETSLPAPSRDQNLVSDDDANPSRQMTRLDQTVLHLQSPTLPTTFIRCPSVGSDLHLKHPWLHIQVKQLGREWSFEVGIVDHAGREGIIRCSTFKVTAHAPPILVPLLISAPQKQPSLKLSPDAPPLLHLSLMFPPTSSLPLTSWCSVDLNVATYLPSFSASSLLATPDRECPSGPMRPVPSGTFSHISYIKVYATCRLRRVWLSETWPLDQRVPWEFELYSST